MVAVIAGTLAVLLSSLALATKAGVYSVIFGTQDTAKPELHKISEHIGSLVARLRGFAGEVEKAVQKMPQKLAGIENEASAVKNGIIEAKQLIVKVIGAMGEIRCEIDSSIESAGAARQGFLERQVAIERKIGGLRRRSAPPEAIEGTVVSLTRIKEAAACGAKTVEPVRDSLLALRADALQVVAELELHPMVLDEAIQVVEQYERLGRAGDVDALVEQLKEARENLRKLYDALQKLAADAEKAAASAMGQGANEIGSNDLVPRATRVMPPTQ